MGDSMKNYILFLFAFLFASVAHTQVPSFFYLTGTSDPPVLTCSGLVNNGNVYVSQVSSPKFYFCSNKSGTYQWDAIGGGSGAVNAGTAGQIGYYASNGTTIGGTGALPNGITATTQSVGDNSTKVATDAFVLANAGGGTAFNVTSYGVKSDGSTDNATAIATVFTASNAITSGIPTVYFPCQSGSQCQYNFSGASTSAIHPTIPTTILCDSGVVLNYTGSAHIMDIGPSGLASGTYVNQPYRVSGCKITDSGTATHGIYVNQYIVWFEADHLTFYDSPASASSTAWPIYLAGYNWDSSIHDNRYIADTNTAINQGVYAYPADINTQLRFFNNHLVCVNGVHGTTGCTTSGSGPVVSGWGSQLSGNNFGFLQPDIRVLGGASHTRIENNYFETAPSSIVPAIIFGVTGDAGGTYVDGLMVMNNTFDTQTAAAFMGPGANTDLLTNLLIDGLHGFNISSSIPLVTLNNLANQYYNEAQHIQTSTGTTPPAAVNINLHTMGLNISPWTALDQLSYSDGFTGSTALVYPWINLTGTGIGGPLTAGSNVVSCTSLTCASSYGVDTSPNVRSSVTISTVPTGTDQAFVATRMTATTATASTSYYSCVYVAGTGIQMYKNATNSYTQLGSTYTTTTPLANDDLILESIGSVHSCYLQHSTGLFKVIGPIVDSAIPTGYAGMGLVGSSGRLANFIAIGLP